MEKNNKKNLACKSSHSQIANDNNVKLIDDLDSPPILALAKIYGQLRLIKGVWQQMITDLLNIQAYSFDSLAEELCVAPRTVRRISTGNTSNPCIEISFQLFLLHLKHYPQQYLCSDVPKD